MGSPDNVTIAPASSSFDGSSFLLDGSSSFDGSSFSFDRSSSFDGSSTEVLHLTEVLRLTEFLLLLLLLCSTEAAPLRGYRSRQRLSGNET